MNLKWGGQMNKNCVYYCEGEDDLKLVDALKVSPGSNVVLVFDTDVVSNLDMIKKNIDNIKKYCQGVNIIYLLQVKNLEDELTRCTDVKSVLELTKSKSLSNFKADFKKLKDVECRYTLERHKIDVNRLWTTPAPKEFDFATRNSNQVKW